MLMARDVGLVLPALMIIFVGFFETSCFLWLFNFQSFWFLYSIFIVNCKSPL